MTRLIKIGLALIGLVALVIVAGIVYLQIAGGDGEASEEISAPTLDADALRAERDAEDVTQEATEEVAVEEIAETEEPEPTEAIEEPLEVATEEMVETTEEVAEAPAEVEEQILFRIISEESAVRFELDEDLRGQRVTVVGSTDQVAGDIFIDRANPADSVVGTIRINVRTLETDNNFRNRAIRAEVLQSARDEYEFSEFTPTSLSGMPESIEIGEAYTFTMEGDLTIRGEAFPVSFDVTATLVTEDRLEGTGLALAQWRDFGISIPSVPSVANVEEELELYIDFVAESVAEGTSQKSTAQLSQFPETPVATVAQDDEDGTLFRLVRDESELRFELEEDLVGQRNTVIGSTDQIAGDMLVFFDEPDDSILGTFRMNLRTLRTDNRLRDRAIRADILETGRDEYEFSDFVPSEIDGLPRQAVEVGDTIEFVVIGELDIKGEPREIEFEVSLEIVSEERLEGIASATVEWEEWDISIPSVPGVGNIEEEVDLVLEFVAEEVEE